MTADKHTGGPRRTFCTPVSGQAASRRETLKRLAWLGAAASGCTLGDSSAVRAREPLRAAPGEYIDCRDFAGLDPDGTRPCESAINAAISSGISQHLPVFLPGGTYRIDGPLIANPRAARHEYANLQFFGAGGLGSLDPIGFPSRAHTVIAPTFVDRPALILDLMSGAHLRGFALQGRNLAPNGIVMPIDRPAAYIGAGCRDNRYSPYCALAIDAFNDTGVPHDDRYPGMSSYYFRSGGGSVGILIEDVWIACFVVGVAYGISGLSANTEDILFRNLWISRVDSCYAVGHSQARHCMMQMGNLGFARQGIDGYHYGALMGCPPKFDRVNHGYLYRIFTLPNAVGNFVLDDNYAESIRTLGNYGLGAGYSRQPLSFLGGDYTITSKDQFTAPPPLLLESYSPTVFKATTITRDANSTPVDALNVIAADTVCSFEQCFLPGSGTDRVPPFVGLVKDAHQVQCRLLDCYAAAATGGAMYLSDDYPRSHSIAPFAPGGRFCATYQSRRVTNGNVEYVYQPLAADNVQCPVAVSDLFLSTDGAGHCRFHTSESHLLVGDILFWGMLPQGSSKNRWVVPALKVASISATLVRCGFLFDPEQYESVTHWNRYSPGQMFIAVRQWAPATPLTGTLHDSTTITDLSAPDILLGNGPGVAGDWVAGAGIAPRTRVISVDTRTATAILSRATSGGAATGVRLYFGRLQVAALSAAF
ncbi:MAG TPA: glycosyl hydrolase family 28-related protein [Steroidobacteraceae bacterium]|nr:glycosyl hydrolase family 28-related protein [Steroidobacteraceae bacterium]